MKDCKHFETCAFRMKYNDCFDDCSCYANNGCVRCEDSAGMVVTVISQLKDGITSGWLGGNLPAKFCPFCGRKLEG